MLLGGFELPQQGGTFRIGWGRVTQMKFGSSQRRESKKGLDLSDKNFEQDRFWIS